MAISFRLNDKKSMDKAIELLKSGVKGSEVRINIKDGETYTQAMVIGKGGEE